MEKIKEALAKAKSATAKTGEIRKRPSEPAETTSTLSLSSEQTTELDLGSIQYIKTRVIEPSAAHLERNRIVTFNKGGPSSWIFDKLRTQVLQKMHENNWKTLAVVSPTPACGKTFVSINLAVSIANQPQKTVMLVDFDLRKPRVAKYLGISGGKSLNDYFDDDEDLDQILVNPNIPRLVVLPTLKPVDNPAETLSSAKTNLLIQDITQKYDSRIVIFDLPPILNTDDSLIMMKKVDCVLLVVGNGMVKAAEVEETMHHIPADKLLGVVLNKSDESGQDYYY